MSVENELLLLHRVELQIEKWKNSKSQKPCIDEAGGDAGRWERPVITISREPGCGAGSIARMLAQEFGLDVFGFELVDLMAHSMHLSSQLVATLDEKTQSWLEDSLSESLGEGHFCSKSYFQSLTRVLLTIAAHRNAVILGRGANFLLRPEGRLTVRLIAPREVRVKKIMLELRLSEKQSREYIAVVEKQRGLFTRKYFHADIEDPANYDLVINVAAVKAKTIIEIVRAILYRKMRAERSQCSIGEWSAEIIA